MEHHHRVSNPSVHFYTISPFSVVPTMSLVAQQWKQPPRSWNPREHSGYFRKIILWVPYFLTAWPLSAVYFSWDVHTAPSRTRLSASRSATSFCPLPLPMFRSVLRRATTTFPPKQPTTFVVSAASSRGFMASPASSGTDLPHPQGVFPNAEAHEVLPKVFLGSLVSFATLCAPRETMYYLDYIATAVD